MKPKLKVEEGEAGGEGRRWREGRQRIHMPENMLAGGLLWPDGSEAKVCSVSQCGPKLGWVGSAALKPRSIRPAHAVALLRH